MSWNYQTIRQVSALCLICISLIGLPLMVQGKDRAQSDGLVLVLHLPWETPEALIEQAGGWPIGPSRAPLGILATSDTPDFHQRLNALGAWTLSNPNLLSLICGASYATNT
jgi:hypothetical protein